MQVSGGALEELERIRKVLEYFEHVKIHIGIGGEPGANAFQKGVKDSPVDLITYARVHEYGAVIKAIHHKNLTIPIHKDAKDKRIKDFQGIFFSRAGTDSCSRAFMPIKRHLSKNGKYRKRSRQRIAASSKPAKIKRKAKRCTKRRHRGRLSTCFC